MELDAQFFQTTLGGGTWGAGAFRGAVTGFSQDTRRIVSGNCFVALKTSKRDGHDFLEDARANGAIVALVSRYQPSCELPQFVVKDAGRGLQLLAKRHRERFVNKLVGITGSAGKTSTKNLIASLLGDGVCATSGNLNNTLGVPLSLLRLRKENSFGVFEAGIDRPGEMDILAEMIQPDIGVVTLIAEAHLERLGSLDGVAREKVKILQGISSDGLAIFTEGCYQYEDFKRLDCPAWVVTRDPSMNLESVRQTRVPYWTETTNIQYGGVRVCISGPLRSLSKFDLPAMSQGMIENAVLAILVAQYLGVADPAIQERLSAWQAADQRGQWVKGADRNVYVDCYNANPASMIDSAKFFDRSTQDSPSRTYILGTMNELGEDASRLHREVASQLPVGPSDRVFCVGAEAEAMRDGILDKMPLFDNIANYVDVESMSEDWLKLSGEIFLKGSRGLKLEALLELEVEEKGAAC
ncbi:MAG: UDP-N-acetylmuramoyl-tripeptide--D-alanyl-D-alanine ligase [Opitutales bacterium]